MSLPTEPPDDEPCDWCGSGKVYRRGLCRDCYNAGLEDKADAENEERRIGHDLPLTSD